MESGILVHQVNCKGVMGGGVALALRNRYPEVFQSYANMVERSKDCNSLLLGKIDIVQIEDNPELVVVNLFGQNRYSRNGRMTEYGAVRSGFSKLNSVIENSNSFPLAGRDIHIPFLMGCGLGGGDWEIYRRIVQEELEGCRVTAHKLY